MTDSPDTRRARADVLRGVLEKYRQEYEVEARALATASDAHRRAVARRRTEEITGRIDDVQRRLDLLTSGDTDRLQT